MLSRSSPHFLFLSSSDISLFFWVPHEINLWNTISTCFYTTHERRDNERLPSGLLQENCKCCFQARPTRVRQHTIQALTKIHYSCERTKYYLALLYLTSQFIRESFSLASSVPRPLICLSFTQVLSKMFCFFSWNAVTFSHIRVKHKVSTLTEPVKKLRSVSSHFW